MNLLCFTIIAFAARISFGYKIESLIPQYCTPQEYNQEINELRLSHTGSNSSVVITASLNEHQFQDGIKCWIIIYAERNCGIIVTVEKASLNSADVLSFVDESNQVKVLTMHENNDNNNPLEVVAKPNNLIESGIYFSFKPTKNPSNLVQFEISFTAFKKKESDCELDFDCGNERCIWQGLKCNGLNNCGNGEDEKGCNEDNSKKDIRDEHKNSDCLNDTKHIQQLNDREENIQVVNKEEKIEYRLIINERHEDFNMSIWTTILIVSIAMLGFLMILVVLSKISRL